MRWRLNEQLLIFWPQSAKSDDFYNHLPPYLPTRFPALSEM